MDSLTKRIIGVLGGVVVFGVLVGLYVGLYLISEPGSASAQGSGGVSNLYLGTVAAAETSDPHPTWVSYYAVDAKEQNWRHKTTCVLPAHTLVHVTIYQYDGQSGLRNPFIAQSTGTVGDSFRLDGKTTQRSVPRPPRTSSRSRQLGVSVPLQGVADNAKNPCTNAPCTLSQATPRSRSRSVPAGPASTAGSASCRAPPASSRASAARCRRSATWTASSRSYEAPSSRNDATTATTSAAC